MKKITFLRDCSGATSMMTVILMGAFIGVLALVIDLGHLHTVQNELSNAADACACRGARAFVPDYITDITEVDPDPANAKTQASLTILVNKSDNTSLQDLPIGDIEVGIWNYTERKLYSWAWPPDPSDWGKYIGPGIRLPTKRTAAYNYGPVSMTLANIFGISTVPVGARATAALSGVGGFRQESCPEVPLCINRELLDLYGKGTQIQFHPDHEDTGGWTNLLPLEQKDRTDASDIKSYLRDGPYCGNLPNETVISMNNGVMCSATKTFIEERDKWGLVEDADPNTKNTWVTSEPRKDYVFPVCTLDKFNQWHIVSGVTAKIIQVSSAPDDCNIKIEIVQGNTVAPGTYGGGPWYGVLSTEPKLVQ